ncbi:carboxypeptidase regulatory-like domain-containing protein, partial [Candidatus Cloacimonadota bacterium]
GIEYDDITVCSNGWVAPGITANTSFMNWQIPGSLGPSPQIAVFWDDLETGPGDVYYYYDSAQNYIVIEWDNMRNEYNTNLEETFQVIIYDSNFYPTATGDSEMKFQYKEFNNVDVGSYPSRHGQYCTVGLEDHTGTQGLEYTFNNTYPPQAKTITDETALLFTGPPISFEEPFIVLGGVTLNDENGNGRADYGESIDLDIMLNNIGEQAATGVSGIISTNDPYITITENTASYNNINGSSSGTNVSDFSIEIAENCIDGHVAVFVLDITSNESTWNLNFTIELNAPAIEYASFVIDDSALGNSNSIFDPGETVNVMIAIANNGGSNGYNIEGELTSIDPYITVNTTGFVNFGNMPAGNSSTQTFSVTAAPNTPYEHAAQFEMNITGDSGIAGSFDFIIAIGVDIELFFDDFESGLGLWTVVNNGGTGSWVIETPPYPNSYQMPPASSGGVAAADADDVYPINSELITAAPINCGYFSEITLEFDSDFNAISSNDLCYVDVSNNNGSTWNNVLSYLGTDVRETHEEIDISTYAAGEDEVLIRFHSIQPGWDWWWVIDNVTVFAGGSPVMFGTVSGTVTDTDSGQPIQDVNVAGLATTSADGSYEIYLAPGTYDLIFTHDDYFEYIADDVIVQENQVTTLNVSMNAIPILEPVTNLEASVEDFNDVLVSWNAPAIETVINNPARVVNTKSRLSTGHKKNENRENSRELSGYLVYENNIQIAEITDPATLSYLDESLDAGTYNYYVIAVYDEGNSEPSNNAAAVVTLPAPSNLVATLQFPDVYLSWDAPTERGLASYNVYRDNVMIAEDVAVTGYIDENVAAGTYFYKVQAVYDGGWTSDFSNEFEITVTDAGNQLIPLSTELQGNYPNPFNPITTIRFALSEDSNVSLEIFNIKGEKVRTLIQEHLAAQYHNIIWNGKDDAGKQTSSGIYFYKMKAGKYLSTKKMILMK